MLHEIAVLAFMLTFLDIDGLYLLLALEEACFGKFRLELRHHFPVDCLEILQVGLEVLPERIYRLVREAVVVSRRVQFFK